MTGVDEGLQRGIEIFVADRVVVARLRKEVAYVGKGRHRCPCTRKQQSPQDRGKKFTNHRHPLRQGLPQVGLKPPPPVLRHFLPFLLIRESRSARFLGAIRSDEFPEMSISRLRALLANSPPLEGVDHHRRRH